MSRDESRPALRELLAELRTRGIRLWVEDGRLRFDAPAGALDERLRERLRARRTELVEALSGAAVAGESPLEPAPAGVARPLSFGQRRLWFLDQLSPDDVAYNVPAVVRLSGPLDVDVLSRALTEVVRRHETLRTRFPTRAGVAELAVDAPAEVRLEPVSLEGLDAGDAEAEALRRAREASEAPFDLARGPLFRALLLRLSATDHVLCVAMHHAVSDGWSMGVFFRELAELYPAFAAGEPSPLPELPLQYADYALWQARRFEERGLERELAYWREQLGGELPELALPTDRPRPRTPSHRGAFVWFEVEPDVRRGLEELARAEGATRFQVLLAAFCVLLHRHTRQTDLVLGTPVAGRPRRELEGLIGFFVNNLVLRCDVEGQPTFRELLARVRTTVLDAFAHAELPFERLVEELRPERELGRNPLFQVLFNHFDLSEYRYELPPLSFDTVDMTLDVSKFDLTLHCFEAQGRLVSKFEFDTDLFDEATVRGLADRYQVLLGAIAADPGSRIGALPLLPESERALLLAPPDASRPGELAFAELEATSVPELLFARAAQHPDAPALRFEDQVLTYAELADRARSLAARLLAEGLGTEDRIALHLERSADAIVALYGVLAAGLAYLPLDPTLPDARLARQLGRAGAKRVLCLARDRDVLAPLGVPTLALDEPGALPVAELPRIRADQLAYVVFTSGTTGEPKGIEVEHAQLLHYLSGLLPRLALPEGASFATVSTLAADLGNTSILGALGLGGCLHVLSEERIGDAERFGAYVRAHRIDALKIVPSHLDALLRAAARPAELLPEKLLVLGGEACTWELVERVRATGASCAIVNHYGPAEATIGVLAQRVELADRERYPVAPPIGTPMGRTRAYLLDPDGDLAPSGAPGELVVSGPAVARGYAGGAEPGRFREDPFRPGVRAYRTGDLARRNPDGTLTFVGRADEQVKIRGFRVEPAEVRATLESQPDVRAAAVVARPDEDGALRLVAYVVPASGRALDATELRARVAERLPEYACPQAYVELEELPLTPNGKLDRGALPAPELGRASLGAECVAPRTEAERTLAEIWCDVLRLEAVGVHDDYFALGGESILSIQIVSRANRAGLSLRPRDVFEHPTIAALAAHASDGVGVRTIEVDAAGPVPLSAVQRRYFELEVDAPQHYNHALLLEPTRPLEEERLARALLGLEERHAALRLRFARTDGTWSQRVVEPGAAAPLSREELDGPDALEVACDRAQGSLDLERGPLWRATWLRTADGALERLLLVVHHLAVDGVSWRVILEDLEALYAGQEPAPLTSPFGAWARRCVSAAAEPGTLAQVGRWLEDLARWGGARLPTDHDVAPGERVAANARTLTVTLDEEETRVLVRDLPRTTGLRTDEVLLAALAKALCRWSGADTVRVDVEGHGREDVFEDLDLSHTVGWFTAVHPITLEPTGAKGVAQRLRDLPDRGIAYGWLRYLAPEHPDLRRLREAPEPEVGFNFMGHFERAIEDSSLLVRAPEPSGLAVGPRNRRRYLLDVGAVVAGGRLAVHLTYDQRTHDRVTIERVAGWLREALGTELEQAGRDELAARYGDALEQVLPLSPLQRGMVFHSLAEPDEPAYVTQLALTLEGDLRPDDLRRAWATALARNAILRSGFCQTKDGELHQVVLRAPELRWRELDLSDRFEDELGAALDALAEEDRRLGFDLAEPPLSRFTLVRLGPDRHRFLWTHHHALLDGWSLPLLVQDVFLAYRGGTLPARPPFAEYLRWLEGFDADAAREHWTALLGDVTEPTPLPAGGGDASAPASHAARGRRLRTETTRALAASARGQRVTLNTMAQAAWALLLARHARTEDVVFGVTVAGRPPELPRVEEQLGLFINTLPLRVDLADRPLAELLADVQRAQLANQPFEASPLYEVQRCAGLTGGAPLFESILVFESYPVEVGSPLEDAGLRLAEAADVSRAPYPLALVVQPGERLRFELRYDPARYDAVTIERLLGHFEQLLESMAANAAGRLSDLAMLTEAERASQVRAWNRTTRPYERDGTVHGRVFAQARRTPDAVAVEFGATRLTYSELIAGAQRVAEHLVSDGVLPGDRVALRLERGPDLIAAQLGVLAAGAAYVPLDPEHPEARLRELIEDAAPRRVLDGPELSRLLATQPLERPALPEPAGEDLAYLIYTSGSTGRPKGTAVPHRAVLRLVRGADYVQCAPGDRVAFAANAAFDAATFELWAPLCNGGTVVGFERDELLEPERTARLLRERGVDVLFLTTALFQRIVEHEPQAFASLRCLLFGGEAVDPTLVRRCLERGAPGRLLHVYGPTECTTFSTWHEVRGVPEHAWTVPIGKPIANSTAFVVGLHGEPAPLGAPGELWLGGDGLARGYWNDDAATAERFVVGPDGARCYRSGDLVRQLVGGAVEFLGRTDHQVKLRGFRVELGEVEAALRGLEDVREVVAIVREDVPSDRRLVAYVTGVHEDRVAELRRALTERLPAYMVPADLVVLDELPLNVNRKVDRRGLPAPERGVHGADVEAGVAPASELERRLARIWCEVLGRERVGRRDNFFDLGGHSLHLLRVRARIAEELGRRLPIAELFQFGTLEQLAGHLSGAAPEGTRAETEVVRDADDGGIAIVGWAGRFPGAPDVERFWENLCAGVESVRFFTEEELRASGVPEEHLRDPRYVPARAVLDDPDRFDARYFGVTPREAELMDPQARLFLECAVHALEDAGCDPGRFEGAIGVFAGASANTYARNLHSRPELLLAAGGLQTLVATLPDFLATRASYLLDLRGPSVTVQTACSTSLVAVHEACRSLREGRADLALAGGVAVTVPWQAGYLYEEGGVRSSDGHCRAFDVRAEGMVSGNGVGIVALKRLGDALRDGDRIHAVVRGSATNNDGSRKVGFTAPSVDGQAEVIRRALASGGIDADSVGYVETHGTGTRLGDPVEVAALTQAFGSREGVGASCALASLKSNMGHLDAAAGVAGLIKAGLAVERGAIPPSLHYEAPNPEIDFDASPFFVNAALAEWRPASDAPRRAGVSSFGIGGTNAHAIVEQPPAVPPGDPPRAVHTLPLSAASPTALDRLTAELAEHLERHPELELADVAYTLQTGRRELRHRRAVVARDLPEAVRELRAAGGSRAALEGTPRVAFLFPGQGAQVVHMACGLYEGEPVFRERLDACADVLRERHELDLLALLFPAERDADAERLLERTDNAQVALFCVELALAELWRAWGVEPESLLGHSVGELVAAHLAGVLSLADALALVVARGRAMERCPRGAMLAVPLGEAELRPHLAGARGVELAARNAPGQCVVSGTLEAVDAFERALEDAGIATTRLRTSHGFHSATMEPARAELLEAARAVEHGTARLPILSSCTGEWLEPDGLTGGAYWGRQLREPVRFSDALGRLLEDPDRILLEVGPGRVLSSLARRHEHGRAVVASLPRTGEGSDDVAILERAVAELWCAGASIDWRARHAGRRLRVSLPLYPFERERYWIERAPEAAVGARRPLEQWLYAPALVPARAAGDARGGEVRTVHAKPAEEGFHELLALFRELGERGGTERVHVDVVVPHGPASPEHALVRAFPRVVALEHPNLSCRVVEVAEDSRALLEAELASGAREPVVVLRGGQRFVESFAPVAGDADDPGLRRRGTYAITGGLGGMGLALAEHLAREAAANLVLLTRRDAAEGADAVARLEAAGGRALVLSADVSDRAALARALEQARAEFGPIHGVVHAAGVPPSGVILRKERAHAEAVLAPKVAGTRHLAELCAGPELDFLVLCSSLNAVKGFPGALDYAAANAYLDAFATARQGRDRPYVVSIGWNRWRESGMAVRAAGGPLAEAAGCSDVEGVAIFRRVLALRPGPHVLVSEVDPRDWDAPEAAAAPATERHARPDVASTFAAPRGTAQEEIAAVWQELFGIDAIGAHDDFFELGGHSLLATQLANRLSARFPDAGLSLRAVFEHPTVAELAALVGASEPAESERPATGTPDLDRLDPDDLEGLSDEELTALLERLDESEES